MLFSMMPFSQAKSRSAFKMFSRLSSGIASGSSYSSRSRTARIEFMAKVLSSGVMSPVLSPYCARAAMYFSIIFMTCLSESVS